MKWCATSLYPRWWQIPTIRESFISQVDIFLWIIIEHDPKGAISLSKGHLDERNTQKLPRYKIALFVWELPQHNTWIDNSEYTILIVENIIHLDRTTGSFMHGTEAIYLVSSENFAISTNDQCTRHIKIFCNHILKVFITAVVDIVHCVTLQQTINKEISNYCLTTYRKIRYVKYMYLL